MSIKFVSQVLAQAASLCLNLIRLEFRISFPLMHERLNNGFPLSLASFSCLNNFTRLISNFSIALEWRANKNLLGGQNIFNLLLFIVEIISKEMKNERKRNECNGKMWQRYVLCQARKKRLQLNGPQYSLYRHAFDSFLI